MLVLPTMKTSLFCVALCLSGVQARFAVQSAELTWVGA